MGLNTDEKSELRHRIKQKTMRLPDESHDWFNSSRWSFLSAGLHLSYRNFDRYHEFDGITEDLVLPWHPHRRELIDNGEADPNPEELQQWQRARARRDVESGWACQAWIVPLKHVLSDVSLSGCAVFIIGDPDSAAEDEPWLDDIFDDVDKAKVSLGRRGEYREV